jgi:hypothetical protein
MKTTKTLPIIFLLVCFSCRAGDKPDETVPREYEGFADVQQHRGVIDDPDGYVMCAKTGVLTPLSLRK